jgi:hypothetical protein
VPEGIHANPRKMSRSSLSKLLNVFSLFLLHARETVINAIVFVDFYGMTKNI